LAQHFGVVKPFCSRAMFGFCGGGRQKKEEGERIIVLGRSDEYTDVDNSVRTSKYTLLNFFPIVSGMELNSFAR
jgi:hypothetical protein